MLNEISSETCRELLARAHIGRVAVSTPTGPQIIPLNYVLDGDSIVFRTAPYTVLGTYGWNSKLAFEVDEFDDEYQTAWSVVAVGRGEMIEDEAELAMLRSLGDPRPWAGGARLLYIRLKWEELTGRHIGAGWPHNRKPMRRSS